LHVFFDEVLVALTVHIGVSKPAGYVIFGNAEAESVWVNLLTHLVGPTFLIFIDCNDHGDVASAFVDLEGTSLSAWLVALHGWSFVNEGFTDKQFLFAEGQSFTIGFVPCVGYRRCDSLLDGV